MTPATLEQKLPKSVTELDGSIAARHEEVERLNAEYAALLDEEPKAVTRELQDDPSESAYRINRQPFAIRRRRAEIEKRLDTVRENELPALEGLRQAAFEEWRQGQYEEALKTARRLRERDEDAWRELSEKIAALYRHWAENIRDLAEERDAFDAEVRSRSLVSPEVEPEWNEIIRPAILPFPIGFLDTFLAAWDTIADEGNQGFRDKTGFGRRSDSEFKLVDLSPDLRAEIRHAVLSGRVEKRQASGFYSGQQPAQFRLPDGIA